MNIDLFLTDSTEAGLVCDGSFNDIVVGIILDAQTHDVTLEFAQGDTLHLNIPMEEAHSEKMLFSHRLYVGFLEGRQLADAYEVPLLYLNDPYGSDFGQTSPLSKPVKSVVGFEQFMKRCKFAQALHRDNLGDEDTARSVLRGLDPNHLEYTPALLRQRQLAAIPVSVPTAGPQTPGLGGTANRPTGRTARSDQGDKKE